MTKILLVEDDKSLREIYGVRLLAEGYDIVSAGDGEEALAMAIKERPTLIISDVMMPKISGFDMLDILRSTTETKDIRVIMMTALSSEDQRLRGESLGADKYLVKSQVGIEDVVRVVHEVLDDSPTATAGNNFSSTDYAAPSSPTPASTAPVYQPAAPATSSVAGAPAPIIPQNIPQAPASPLPRPTNAYETPRPVGSSERIIQPLPSSQNPSSPPDMTALLDRELAAEASAAAVPSADSAPAPSPLPSYSSAPTPPPIVPNPDYELSPELRQQLVQPPSDALPPLPVPAPAPAAPQTGVSSEVNAEPEPSSTIQQPQPVQQPATPTPVQPTIQPNPRPYYPTPEQQPPQAQ